MTTHTTAPLRTAIVGCGGMGRKHARVLAMLPDYELVAGCDLLAELAREFAAQFPGAKPYADYGELLAVERPDVVVVATNNATHAALTIQAAEAGVRGIYCEKPMATCMADGWAMVETCRRHGVALAVNHQRRTLPVFQAMRRLIAEGAIGEVELICASCAGDLLSDGIHLIDTIRHLAGDAEVRWVFGQVYRVPPDPAEPRGTGYHVSGGWRYGHPVETGALGVFEFAGGLRAEVHTGGVQIKGRRYQDYQVFGTRGRLWRAGDAADPPLLIQTDAHPGWAPAVVEPHAPGTELTWTFEQFARMVRTAAGHPLAGDSALKSLEVVMAIYEAARQHRRIDLPLEQPRFPLELMIEQGEL